MTKIHPYLNFDGQCEAAFEFYKSVFGGEFDSVNRFGEMPPNPDMPPLPDDLKNQIMHISLPISEHFVIMGSDTLPGMGPDFKVGSNYNLMINPTSLEDTERFFKQLSDGGSIIMPLKKTFWGAYFGSLIDKFGIQWMVDFEVSEE